MRAKWVLPVFHPSVMSSGQSGCQRLEAQDSLFNRVARDLSVDMRNHWHPDRRFFERRTRDQLVASRSIAATRGAGRVASYKKADLVNCLIRHFNSARAAATPTPAQQKARQWLPDAMQFPAVDPDAAIEPNDEAAGAPGRMQPKVYGRGCLTAAAPA